jgi:hypothetical protein
MSDVTLVMDTNDFEGKIVNTKTFHHRTSFVKQVRNGNLEINKNSTTKDKKIEKT